MTQDNNKTFFGALIAGLLSLFVNNFEQWIKKLWNKQVPDEIKPQVSIIVDIVQRIKNFVDGPGMDLITWAIPGDSDDEVVRKLREYLRNITAEENSLDTPTSEYTRGQLQTIASELTARYLDMSYGQAAITVEGAFQNLVKIPEKEAVA